MTKMQPDNFKLEQTSIWSFPEHGNWATHDSKYRGNWSPYVPRNIVLKYSREGDIVLDQFVGGGTTLVETKLLNRIGLGVDINERALQITRKKLNFKWNYDYKTYLKQGNACKLDFIPDQSVDLICTHPPYADIIHYSQGQSGDLSLLNYEQFLQKLNLVAKECRRVLKENKYCAILIGDIRQHGLVKPLGFEVLNIFLQNKFQIKEIIIKEQFNCKGSSKWENKQQRNFLLLAHEYLFVMKK